MYRYRTKLSVAATVAFLAGAGAIYGTPVINEVMTANITSIQDDFERDPGACPVDDCEAWFAAMGASTNDGDNPDWVEIYNPDTLAVDLAGYALSDDTLKPRRWTIPSIILPPRGRTVFFATGKDRAGTPYWHTNFSLTAGGPAYNMLDHATSMGATWPATARTTLMQRRLFENRTFVNLFVNRYGDLMNTKLLPDSMLACLDSLAALYAPEMPRHIERWKALSAHVRSMADWDASLERIRSFIRARSPHAREHIRKKFDLTGWHRLTLRIEPAGAGVIRLNTITVAGSAWSGDYFAGVPVRLSAMPAAGRRFAQWSGPAVADSFNAGVSIDPVTDITVTARFDADSGACNAVVINEINYHPAAAFDPGDWVELYNGYSVPMDVSGWTFATLIHRMVLYLLPGR